MKFVTTLAVLIIALTAQSARANMPDCFNGYCLRHELFSPEHFDEKFVKDEKIQCSTVMRFNGSPDGFDNIKIEMVYYTIYNPEIWQLVYLKRIVNYDTVSGDFISKVLDSISKKYGEPEDKKTINGEYFYTFDENERGATQKLELEFDGNGGANLTERVVGYDLAIEDIEKTVNSCIPQYDEKILPN